MTGYSWLMARLPERGALPITQTGDGGRACVGFWFLFQTEADLGLGRLLPDGAAPRGPPHQPVLDAGEPGLRPASGQAAVRVHRRRRAARRHRRIGDPAVATPRTIGTTNMLLISGTLMLVCAGMVADDPAARAPRPRRRSATPKEEKGVSATEAFDAAAQVEAPADHRAGDQLRGGRRGDHRAAAEHGRGRQQGRRRDRLDHRVPGQRPAVDVDHRLRDPGLAHQQDPPLPRASGSR